MTSESEKSDGARRELYKDPDLEVFFTAFLGDLRKIKPEFDLANGYMYAGLEKLLENGSEGREGFLERMAEAKILDKQLYDVEIRCPDCGSPNVSTNYLCPYCKSVKIVRNTLVEHIPCGYTDTQVNFEAAKTCPRCNKEFKEGGYRMIGRWYQCGGCGKQLETPFVAHLCRSCGEAFSFDNAVCREVYSYSLSGVAQEELKVGILYPSRVRNLLTELGFDVKNPGWVEGKSGVNHKFDFLASNAGAGRLAVDISFSLKAVMEFEVMRECSKIFDTEVKTYFVAMPKLEEGAGKLAKSYRLRVIEAAGPQEALDKLRGEILQSQ